MAETSEIAISMFIVGAALSMLLMGLLISYYGSSKTRNVGVLFLVIGAAMAYYVTSMAYDDVIFMSSILAFIGGMLGGIVGIIMFLVAIIKS
ncbi:uncharacterized protein METZ01_LOCUS208990 [marine metagenome]|uniref:Uncharacterized protein n=1 Tax=marine metagenome TaxID=408172 RepID=A0A382EZH4_9ZZZZ|tara:strand:- start:1643 stop:1918 length:276 start_codon:yes stop_codon:yes gene_type:complete